MEGLAVSWNIKFSNYFFNSQEQDIIKLIIEDEDETKSLSTYVQFKHEMFNVYTKESIQPNTYCIIIIGYINYAPREVASQFSLCKCQMISQACSLNKCSYYIFPKKIWFPLNLSKACFPLISAPLKRLWFPLNLLR